MRGKTELKKGQIGKITVLNDTTIFHVKTTPAGEVELFDPARIIKRGEEYRVYGTKYIQGYAPLYDLGGGLYVIQESWNDNSKYIKYETPSKAKLAQLGN